MPRAIKPLILRDPLRFPAPRFGAIIRVSGGLLRPGFGVQPARRRLHPGCTPGCTPEILRDQRVRRQVQPGNRRTPHPSHVCMCAPAHVCIPMPARLLGCFSFYLSEKKEEKKQPDVQQGALRRLHPGCTRGRIAGNPLKSLEKGGI